MTHNEKCEKEIVYVQAPYMENMDDDEIDLLELWDVLWSAKWFIMGFSLLCTIVAVLVTLYVLPEIFKSTATLEPTQKESGSRLSSLVSNLPIPVSLPGGGGGDSSMMNFLQSRTLQERLITKYGLLQHIYKDQWDAEAKQWLVDDPKDAPSLTKALQQGAVKNFYSVSQDDESGLISLSWSDQEPPFAKKMLDAIIEELRYYLDKEYVFDAKREREFIESQLAKSTRDLEYWERQVPKDNLTLSTIARERQAALTVYTELRKQLELARISEAKEFVTFKILDAPFIPEQRDKPKRSMICALTLVASGFMAIFLVFVRRFVKNAKSEREKGSC